MPPSSSSLSSPTADEANLANYDADDEVYTTMSRNDSGDALLLPPFRGAGENRKVQPEEVAIVTFILGCNSIPSSMFNLTHEMSDVWSLR